MPDIMGVLGESTVANTGTNTVYTCPSTKSARAKIMFRGVSGVNSTLAVAVNGITIFETGALTSGHVHYSSKSKQYNTAATAGAVNGSSDDLTVAPGPHEFFLNQSDVVTYTIGTANFTSINVQVVGVELDGSK